MRVSYYLGGSLKESVWGNFVLRLTLILCRKVSALSGISSQLALRRVRLSTISVPLGTRRNIWGEQTRQRSAWAEAGSELVAGGGHVPGVLLGVGQRVEPPRLLGASPASAGPRNISQACGRRAEGTFSGFFVQPCTGPSRGPPRRLAVDNICYLRRVSRGLRWSYGDSPLLGDRSFRDALFDRRAVETSQAGDRRAVVSFQGSVDRNQEGIRSGASIPSKSHPEGERWRALRNCCRALLNSCRCRPPAADCDCMFTARMTQMVLAPGTGRSVAPGLGLCHFRWPCTCWSLAPTTPARSITCGKTCIGPPGCTPPKILQEAFKKKKAPRRPRRQQDIPLIFVNVNPAQATAEAPKNAKYYSDKNSRAANPEPDKITEIPKIDGKQTEVVKTETIPRPEVHPAAALAAPRSSPRNRSRKSSPSRPTLPAI